MIVVAPLKMAPPWPSPPVPPWPQRAQAASAAAGFVVDEGRVLNVEVTVSNEEDVYGPAEAFAAGARRIAGPPVHRLPYGLIISEGAVADEDGIVVRINRTSEGAAAHAAGTAGAGRAARAADDAVADERGVENLRYLRSIRVGTDFECASKVIPPAPQLHQRRQHHPASSYL